MIIHKLKHWEGLFWKAECGIDGMNKWKVTEDNSKVTCSKCLRIIGVIK